MLVLCTAALISFLGQLPFGNMNLTATQLAFQESVRRAWYYALGIVLVEIIYLRMALSAMHWVVQHKKIFQIMNWVAAVVFLLLGVLSIVAARKQTAQKKGLLLNNHLNRFVLGVSVSAINPAQIPFWFLWTTTMLKSGALQNTNTSFNLFTTGAALGSLAGLAVYIYAGKWTMQKLNASNRQINIFIGIVFIIAALLQLYNALYGSSM